MREETITSPQNPRIKAVARLRDRRGRTQSDLILIDGRREITRALEGQVAIEELYYCRAVLDGPAVDEVIEPARRRGSAMVEVSEPVLEKISYGNRADGLVAVARRPVKRLADLHLEVRPLVCVAERIEKPGNLGAILRSADAAGIDAVVAADPVTDVYGPNVIRASLGTVFTRPLVEATAAETLDWLRQRGLSIVAATPDGDTSFWQLDMTKPTALVLGAEAAGLSPIWRQADIVQTSIPMRGRADSLNASVTAAVFFYEAMRQRRPQTGGHETTP